MRWNKNKSPREMTEIFFCSCLRDYMRLASETSSERRGDGRLRRRRHLATRESRQTDRRPEKRRENSVDGIDRVNGFRSAAGGEFQDQRTNIGSMLKCPLCRNTDNQGCHIWHHSLLCILRVLNYYRLRLTVKILEVRIFKLSPVRQTV